MSNPVVIFVPGIMGTKLMMGKSQVWPARDDLDAESLKFLGRAVNPIRPSEILDEYHYEHPWFGRFKRGQRIEPVASPLLSFLQEDLGCRVVPCPYDWRLDLSACAGVVAEAIVKNPGAVVVAHSRGGLVTKAAIHQLEDSGTTFDVSKVVTLGTPWLGSPDAFLRLKFGRAWPIPWPTCKLVSADKMAEVTKTIPSAYELLPSKEYFDREKQVSIVAMDGVYFDYHQFREMIDTIHPGAFSTYTDPAHALTQRDWPSRIPHINVVGTGKFTVRSIWDKKQYAWNTGHKVLATHTNGDETVPVTCAVPLHKVHSEYVESGHLELLNSSSVRHVLRREIWNTPLPVNSGVFSTPSQPSGKIIRVACPVRVTVKHGSAMLGPVDLDHIENLELIEGVGYQLIGDAKFISLPLDEAYEVSMDGFDDGVVSVGIAQWQNGTPEKAYLFEKTETDVNTTTSLFIPSGGQLEPYLTVNDQDEVYTVAPVAINNLAQLTNPPQHSCRIAFTPVDSQGIQINGRMYFRTVPKLTIEPETNGNVDILEVWYQLNGSAPQKYNGPILVKGAVEGENTVVAVATDTLGRDQLDAEKQSFWLDSTAPTTRPLLTLSKDGASLHLSAKKADDGQAGVKHTDYRLDRSFQKYEKPIPISFKDSIALQFYSEDKIGNIEATKSLILDGPRWLEVWERTFESLGDLFGRLFPSEPIESVQVDGKQVDRDTPIPDFLTVGEIVFDSATMTVILSLNPNYDLYWVEPPVEWVTRGEQVKFEFTLATPSGFHVTSSGLIAYINPEGKTSKKNRVPVPLKQHGSEYCGTIQTWGLSLAHDLYHIHIRDDRKKKLRKVPLQLHNP